jgi:hypothetical protein
LACDLEAVGYRLVKQTQGDQAVDVVEFGVKLHQPVTSWDLCEISVQLDTNGDGIADQELIGESKDGKDTQTVLYDAAKLRSVRQEFEATFPKQSKPDFAPAELYRGTAVGYRNSTVAVVSVPLSQLGRNASGLLSAKIAVLGDPDNAVADDFFRGDLEKWQNISLDPGDLGFLDLPSSVALEQGESKSIEIVKGGGRHQLMVLLPHNRSSLGQLTKDEQMQIVRAKYE